MIRLINGDCLEEIKNLPNESVDSVVTDPPYWISFMGKKWDYDVPSVELWKEVMRVMKPGAHALVACGTRTQHRMAVNLEDAWFEIRDLIAWVYGSGFPKSLDVGKAIDKLQWNKREVIGINKNWGMSIDKWMAFRDDNWVPESRDLPITKWNTEWEWWGTALKPSMELWTLVRKPLEEKTVAENVLKYGTGGINIDASRIGNEERTYKWMSANKSDVGTFRDDNWVPKDIEVTVSGRFPANFIHDGSEEVEALFPNENQRFFYCAKASTKERNEGLEGMEAKRKVFNGQSSEPSKDMKDVEKRFTTQPRPNNHPTVKPLALMRYLVRLVTPKGGVVMDPFCGSGTTGVACREEGFGFIWMEREKEYIEIARNRIGDVLEKS